MHTSSTLILVAGRVRRQPGGDGRGADHRGGGRREPGLASGTGGCGGGASLVLGVLVLVVGVPLIRYIPLDALRVVVGGAAAGARPDVVAQGHTAGERAQGSARRGQDLCGDGGRARTRRTRRRRRHRPRPGPRKHDGVGVRRRLQGRLPGGHRGRADRGQPGRGAAPPRPGRARRGGGRRPGGGGRPGGGAPAERGSREHHQDGGRRHVDQLRRVLGRRGRRRALAGRRPGHPGAGRVLRRRLLRLHRVHAHAAPRAGHRRGAP